MKASVTVLQLLAGLIVVICAIGAILAVTTDAGSLVIPIIAGGAVSAALLWGMSDIIDLLARIADDNERSANALERRLPKPQPSPMPKRLRRGERMSDRVQRPVGSPSSSGQPPIDKQS